MRGRQLVGFNLRRIRVAQGLPQERLAFDSGVDRSYLGGMERGTENPTVDILGKVAATLAIAIGELFAESCGDGLGGGLKRGRKPLRD